ncbi:MAG: hypothetical protein NTW28_08465 [Candidatus Solibacter sp.]|nr:hypothetical protein [Candidatus Solibacter sp.]
MTITYADGTAVEALLLSFEEGVLRLAIAGDDDVRVFSCIDGVCRAENGQQVQLKYSQNDRTAPASEESHFICCRKVGRQLIGNLMNGSEVQDAGTDPFFVFSAEKRRVRVTVVRSMYRRTISQLAPQ